MTGTARGSPHACFSPEGTDREGSLYLEILDSVLALSLGDVYNSDPTDENTKHTHTERVLVPGARLEQGGGVPSCLASAGHRAPGDSPSLLLCVCLRTTPGVRRGISL